MGAQQRASQARMGVSQTKVCGMFWRLPALHLPCGRRKKGKGEPGRPQDAGRRSVGFVFSSVTINAEVAGGEFDMGGLSVWHWLIVLILVVGSIAAMLLARRSIRRFFIATAEFVVLFAMFIFVIGSGVAGFAVAETTPGMSGGAGFALGAFLGLLVSIMFSAVFFLLVEIADNTRRTVSFFERVSERSQRRVGEEL